MTDRDRQYGPGAALAAGIVFEFFKLMFWFLCGSVFYLLVIRPWLWS